MRLHGVHIGAVEHILVGVRIVFADPLDEIVLPHHLERPRNLLAGDELRQQLAPEPAAGFALGLHARQICRSSRHSKPLVRRRPAPRIISGYHGKGGGQQAFAACRGRVERAAKRTESYHSEKKAARAKPGRQTLRDLAEISAQSSSSGSGGSGRSSGGARPSRPLSSSSSVMWSTVTSVSSASTPPPPEMSGIDSGSGSSTSTYFCSAWIRSSLRSPGEIVSSAISRSATTGFLSLSRSMVIWAPEETIRARWLASNTSSNRFSTLSMQSSTVTRAMTSALLVLRAALELLMIFGLTIDYRNAAQE